jgi:hypothetical protein
LAEVITSSDDSDLLWMWDVGYDTYAISAFFGINECDAERRVWRAREQRRIKTRGVVYELA